MQFIYFTHRGFKCKALIKNHPVKNVTVRNLVEKSDANSFIQDLVEECLKGSRYTLKQNKATKMKDEIVISCPDHGDFKSTACKIKSGVSCKKCQLSLLWGKSRTGLGKFIEKATAIHGGKYDYSEVEYFNSHTKIKIICPIHGVFQQQPNNHLYGKRSGCPSCGQEKRTSSIRQYSRKIGYAENMKDRYIKICRTGTNLYVMKFSNCHEVFYKVGISKNIPVRLYNLRHKSPYQVELLSSKWFEDPKDAYELEQTILTSFRKYSPQTSFGGCSECTLFIEDIKKHLGE